MLTINMEATGANIGVLRDAAGLNNRDLATALGFTTNNAIYKWLNGTSMPSLDNLVVLANVLGVTMDEIIVTNS